MGHWHVWEPRLWILDRFQDIIITALQTAIPKQKNLGKIYDVHQGPSESPSDFLECLYQAFRKYSDLDREASENSRLVNMLFIGQSAPDIQCKLQKLDGVLADTIGKLLEVAYQVYAAWPEATAKGVVKKSKKCSVVLLTQALQRIPLRGGGCSSTYGRGRWGVDKFHSINYSEGD